MDTRMVSICIAIMMIGTAFLGATKVQVHSAEDSPTTQAGEQTSAPTAEPPLIQQQVNTINHQTTSSRGGDQDKYSSHLATRQEIEALKARIGVREKDKNYNLIYDGLGTGLAPPTEEEWEAMIGTLEIVDSVEDEPVKGPLPLGDDPGATVDLMADPSFPAVYSQGAEGSCASWSTAYYTNGFLQAKDYGWTDQHTSWGSANKDHLMSVDWVYHKVNGGSDSGSNFENPMGVISTLGNCPESYMPYSTSDHTSWGDEDAWRQAPIYRAGGYQTTSVTNIDVVKSWIDDGYAVPMALNAGQYSKGWTDGNGIMSNTEYTPGSPNHANTVVGYNDSIEDDNETGAFKIVNSWGASWGPLNNGTYYMTYDCFKNLTWSLCYRFSSDKDDYEPSLLGIWNLDPQGARNAGIEMGVGQYGSPEETRTPKLRGGNHNFPSFMCLDITEFQDNWDAGTNTFYLEIGSGASSSTISSFKIERYQGSYTPGSPTETSPESPDTPESTPGYVTLYFPLSEGRVRFDNIAYQSNALAIITLGDRDLNTNSGLAETYVIDEVRSDPTGDSETTTITLTETDVNTGVFIGSIQLMPGGPNIDDGFLQVGSGDTITVRYEDADNGTGNPATATDTAAVDDDPPVISSVSAEPSYTTAVITWNTDEDSDSLVSYSIITPPTLTEGDTAITTAHSVKLTGLSVNTAHYYEVRSTDSAGNTALDDNGSAYYTFTTLPPEIAPWSDDMDSGHEWWTNETIGAGTEWQLGDPAGFGPGSAYSGSNCWGTNIDSDYSNLVEVWLVTPPIDLTLAATANLTFWNWYEIEKNWDVGVVEISNDLGDTWTVIEPAGGYPDWTENFGDGYSSDSGGWVSGTEEEFDLSPYLGSIILIGFHFKTDTFVIDPGWYIDNVTVDAEYVPIGVTIVPSSQSQIGLPNTTVSYPMKVINIGYSGSDIFDLTYSSPSGWTVSFYESDGATPLGDANTNGKPDTGNLAVSGGTTDIIVKVDIPDTAVETASDSTTITATSTNDPLVSGDAILTTSIPYYIESKLAFTNPTIDGIISPGEWTDAEIVDISSSDASPGTAFMYVKNNETMLYIAVVDTNDISLDTNDRIGFYFDDDHDHTWPDNNSPTGEGNFWVRWDGTKALCQYRGIWGSAPNMEPTVAASGVTGDISIINGYIQYEMAIDLTTSALQSSLGSTIGLFVFSYDTGTGTFYGEWPPDGVDTYTDPSTYGDLIIAEDTEPPISSVDAVSPYWQTGSPLNITAAASDIGGSVMSVELFYRFSADNQTWGGWISAGADTANPWEWTFNFPEGEGHYEFKTNATDSSDNAEIDTGKDASCGYDAEPPISCVDVISPYWQTTSPLTVTVNASDAVSGLTAIELFYRYSIDNSTWAAWISAGLATENPWMWSFNFPDGEGYYEFYSIAADNATNEEVGTGTDAICGYDCSPPSANAGFDISVDEDEIFELDGSGSTDNLGIANLSWDLGDGDFCYGMNPSHSYHRSGTYIVTLNVRDKANNADVDILTVYVNNLAPNAYAGNDQIIDEGETAFFDGSGSSDTASDMSTLIYTWYFDDGEMLSGVTASHVFKDNGDYTVTLVVEDDNGYTDSDTVHVTVNNVPPTADIGGPYSGEEGTQVNFSGSASDPGDDILTFKWDFDEDGEYDDGFGESPGWYWDEDGVYTIALNVSDEDGGFDVKTTLVNIGNVQPVALVGGPYSGDEGGVVTFYGNYSDPSPVDVISYLWDLGDGNTSTLQNPTHTYADDGVYVVTLAVTDDDGGTGFASTTATIANVAPNADAGGPYSGDEGDVISFIGSQTDPGLDTFTYLWDFGDGVVSTQKDPDHVYADDGVYTVTLSVRDDEGGAGSTTTTAAVSNSDPVADIGGTYSGDEGGAVNFYGDYSDPSPVDTVSYIWDFGDGESSSLQNPTHTYADDGYYIVTLTVIDDDGGIGTAGVLVTISNVAPTADAGGPYVGDEGSAISLIGSQTDPGDDTFTYLWDFGNGDTSTSQNPENTYDDNGVYLVTLTVIDDDGGLGVATTTVTIRNVLPIADAGEGYLGFEGEAISLFGSQTDPGADTFTYLWNFGDGTLSTQQNPAHAYPDNGIYAVTLTVTDDDGGIGTDTTMVAVNNKPPKIVDLEDMIPAKENQVFMLKINVEDAEGDEIIFTDDSDMFDIDPTSGLIQFTPSNDDVGIRTVTITAKDDDGGTATTNLLMNIINENDPPILEDIGPQIAVEDRQFIFTVSASDIDSGGILTFSDNTELFEIDRYTGSINFIPTNDKVGAYIVTITVKDPKGAMDWENVSFTVTNTNDAPVLSSIPNQHVTVGETFTYTVIGSDIDDNMLIFSDDSELFVIDPVSGVVSFIPEKDDVGVHVINIKVSDGHGGNDTQTMLLEIEGLPEKKIEQEPESDWMSLTLIILLIIVILLLLIHMLTHGKVEGVEEPEDEGGSATEDFVEKEVGAVDGERPEEFEDNHEITEPRQAEEQKDTEEKVITEQKRMPPRPPHWALPVVEGKESVEKPAPKKLVRRKPVKKRKMLKVKKAEGAEDTRKLS